MQDTLATSLPLPLRIPNWVSDSSRMDFLLHQTQTKKNKNGQLGSKS